MITKKSGMFWAVLLLMLPTRLVSQTLLRLPKEQLTAFVTHVGGMDGARAIILAKTTSQSVREAVADSLVAIVNSTTGESETHALSPSDALAALMTVAESDVSDVSEIGWNHFISMALNGSTLLVRMNAVTMLGMLDDKVNGASALKMVATSRSDAATEAVLILGSSYGAIGVSTLRGIFHENSAVDKVAAGAIGNFAKRYKWTRP